jgi:hypothetical protein
MPSDRALRFAHYLDQTVHRVDRIGRLLGRAFIWALWLALLATVAFGVVTLHLVVADHLQQSLFLILGIEGWLGWLAAFWGLTKVFPHQAAMLWRKTCVVAQFLNRYLLQPIISFLEGVAKVFEFTVYGIGKLIKVMFIIAVVLIGGGICIFLILHFPPAALAIPIGGGAYAIWGRNS